MTLNEALKPVLENQGFEIEDYGNVISPTMNISLLTEVTRSNIGDLEVLNISEEFSDDDKQRIQYQAIEDIVDQTYQAISSDNVVESVYMESGVNERSIYRIVEAVVKSISIERVAIPNPCYLISFSAEEPDIDIILIKDDQNVDMYDMINYIESALSIHKGYKLLLVSVGNRVNKRLVPVLNKYAKIALEKMQDKKKG